MEDREVLARRAASYRDAVALQELATALNRLGSSFAAVVEPAERLASALRAMKVTNR